MSDSCQKREDRKNIRADYVKGPLSMSDEIEGRWREKYYDKCDELNHAERMCRERLVSLEHARAERDSLKEKLAIAMSALDFYSDGAGIYILDEGRNYRAHSVAYENSFKENEDHFDKPLGTKAKLALDKIKRLEVSDG